MSCLKRAKSRSYLFSLVGMKAAFVVSRCGRELCSLLSDIEVKNIGSAALPNSKKVAQDCGVPALYNG